MTGDEGRADERWARLVGELRENQARAAAEPPERIPRVALAVVGALLFVLFYFAGGILILGPALKPFFP